MGLVIDTLLFALRDGAVYALVALGIVLVYKATKVLNFAQGSIGSAAVFAGYYVLVGGDVGAGLTGAELGGSRLVLALLVTLMVGAFLGVATNLLLRRLASTTPVTSLVATAGVALLLVALQVVVFEARARSYPRPVDGPICLSREGAECVRPLTLPFSNIPISWHFLVILAVLIGAAALLALLFQTPPGTALLATSQDAGAARLQGISVQAMTTMAWALAGVLGAIAAILAAGVFDQISPGYMLSTWLIPGFTAAVLGGITSMVGAVAGGFALGLVVAVATQAVQSLGLPVPGAPQIAVLVALLLVLLLRPAGLLGKAA